MKKLNKKGFTITELVVVISVIAILSAVMIPTFSGIINKSKASADQQAVASMNRLLAGETDLEDVDDVIEYLVENDYAENLTTYYKKYSLGCVIENGKSTIVLVEDNKVVYPSQYKGVTTYEALTRMVTNGNNVADGLEDGKVVYIGSNITAKDGISTSAAGTYEVSLSGNTVKVSDYVGSWVEDSKLVISNGTIDAMDSTGNIAVYAGDGGEVELNNVQVYAGAGKNCIQCYGGTLTLNNVTTAQSGSAGEAWYNSAIQVINNIKQNSEGKWEIYGEQAHTIINGGMYSGKRTIQISAPGGNVTINDGTFVGTEYVINGDFAPQYYGYGENYESVITINGGTFTGTIRVTAATKLVVNGGTFSVNIGEVANVKIGSGKTVVDNGNGTWTVR